MISNICRANFNGGRTAQGNNRYQWDYGQILEISGIENLPDPFTAQFSNTPVLGTAKTAVGTGGSVEIPNEYFVSGQNIYCFIVLHTDEDDGRTVYIATIPVTKRPQPIDDPITPTQQSTIDTAIAALQAGVSRAEGFAGDAEEQAGIAQNAATTATEAATQAEGAVADVEAAATRAEQAADGAEASATAAEASATGAESAKTVAQAAKDAAETAAASAEQSATDAGNYAGLAEGAETSAATSATAAEAFATAAAGSASAASGSASQAAQKASEASASATAAETSATNAEAAKTGAETAQTAAETAQASAEEAEANAQQSATTAEWYAERVERFLPTDTASGEIASFPDGADGVPMQSVEVTMEPVQDLHGYDSPWPAGGGKNKANVADYSQSFTNQYYVDKEIGVTLEAGVTYTFSIDVSSTVTPFAISIGVGSSGSYRRDIIIKQNQTNGSVYVTFTPTAEQLTDYTELYVRVPRFSAPQTGTASVSKIQLELGSTATTYAPYENLCPISGRTGAEVTRTGKNLFDQDTVYAQCKTADNTYRAMGSLFTTIQTKIPSAFIGKRVTFSAYLSGDDMPSNVRVSARVNGVELNGNILSANGFSSVTFTPKTASDNVRITYGASGAKYITASSCQFEIGSERTAYKPYQGETLSVSWESEAGTVYGGTLDVVGGELVVDRKLIIPRTVIAASASPIANWIFGISDNPSLSDNSGKIVSNYFAKGRLAPGKCYITNTGKYIVCAPVDDTLNTYALANAWLAEHDLQFCYELATPITYHLTPQEVRTLLGTNNVWSDAGDVAVTYKADVQLYIDKRISAVS